VVGFCTNVGFWALEKQGVQWNCCVVVDLSKRSTYAHCLHDCIEPLAKHPKQSYISVLLNQNLPFMNLVDRIKNILVKPKEEWPVINGESATPMSLLTGYVLPLAVVAAICSFIGFGLIGTSVMGIKIGGVKFGLYNAIRSLLITPISFFVTVNVIDALAPTFKSEKNLNKTAQLVAFASTASYVGSFFTILPALSVIGLLLGLYGIYLFYLGMPILKKTPQDQVIPYMLVSALVLIVVFIVVGFVLNSVLNPIFGNPMNDMMRETILP
jgi:hypothetical protein